MTRLPYDLIAVPKHWDRKGLPAWAYHSKKLFQLERDDVFMTHWQFVGHDCDVPNPGDWIAFDLLGERALVMRGRDGVVRAFHNLCRHRGARVVDGVQGSCKGSIVCPFHGWVYNLDGTLRGAAQPTTFDEMKREDFGLKPIELERFHGFIFIRFKPGPQPGLATLLAPLAADFAAYGVTTLAPVFVPDWSADLPVNWKSVRDVDNEGYHVPLAHPGLQDLYGRTYMDGYMDNGLTMSIGWYGDVPGSSWSVRHYNTISPPRPDLPQHLQKAWVYFGIFPATVFTFTPEGMQVYYDVPLTESSTRVTARVYRWPNETRAARLARYLAYRIDRATSAEDQQLSIWSNESMKSDAFEGFHLSDLEYGVRRHHDGLRRLLPVLTLNHAPPEDRIAEVNAEMSCQTWGHQ